MNAQRKSRHDPEHWPVTIVITAAVVALVLAVAGSALLEMTHPLSAVLTSLR